MLFIGPSTVREGFDDELHRELTSICSINAGVTSHGSIYHIALLLDITKNLDIKPEVIVLGINSRMLSDRENPITFNRYLDFLDHDQIQFYRRYEYQNKLPSLEKDTLINELFPLARYAIRLDYLIRDLLMSTNLAIGNYKKLDVKSFSRGNDLLLEPNKFIYTDKYFNEAAFLKQIEGAKGRGLINPARYGWVDHIHGLNIVLEQASEIAPKVVIAIMPEHSEVRKGFGAYADRAFYKVLAKYESEALRVVDYSQSIDDHFIRDIAHLTATGRQQLTKKISTFINSL
ncbi:hypothetical protein ACMXYO_02055 [Neptuniibacter sp. QD37_6]|uniref:hypothetical protein n=1 Tax=Neptuniibacter sp. QD37_6 TaxID=3398210 RepID=UPI0039F47F42